MATKLFKYQYQPDEQQFPSADYQWLVEGSEPPQFIDSQNIGAINAMTDSKGRDFNFRRDAIISIVNTTTGFNPLDPATYTTDNWDKLSNDDKTYACMYFAVPSTFRLMQVTQEVDEHNWGEVIKNTYGSRSLRLIKGKQVASYALAKVDSDQFFKDVKILFEEYKEANTSDLVEWISNTVGSDYENDGFAQRTYYSVELKDTLIDIIVNGNYTVA